MKIVNSNVYVGPNIYAHFPVIRHVLDLEQLEDWPTGKLGKAFVDPLLDTLPGLHEHGCSYREPGGFVRRLHEDEGTWLGHVMEHVAIELQNVAGSNVTFGRTRSIDGQPGLYNMVFQYLDTEVGREASRLSLDLIHSLLPDEVRPEEAPPTDWNFAEERDHFIRYAQARAFGPSTASLVQAPAEPGAIRSRAISATDPGDDHGAHQQYRGRTGVRQRGNEQDTAGPRPAGAAAKTCAARTGCGTCRGAYRFSCRAQAPFGESRPWRVDQPEDARGNRGRL
jgi:cyanophycin synthetase